MPQTTLHRSLWACALLVPTLLALPSCAGDQGASGLIPPDTDTSAALSEPDVPKDTQPDGDTKVLSDADTLADPDSDIAMDADSASGPDVEVADVDGNVSGVTDVYTVADVDAVSSGPDLPQKEVDEGWLIVGGPEARVEIPPGALAKPLPIAVTHFPDALGVFLTKAWQMTPDGTQFAKPVRVVFTVDSWFASNCKFNELRVATWNGSSWEPLTAPGRDLATLEIWGETTHFSLFAVIMPPDPPQTGVCPKNFTSQGSKCVCSAPGSTKPGPMGAEICKKIFGFYLGNCFADGGDSVSASLGPCCKAQVDACKYGPGALPPMAVTKCLEKLDCATVQADPWAAAASCGAFP